MSGIQVTRATWINKQTGEREPAVQVRGGKHWLTFRYAIARQVVDQVHDIADEIEREQREAGQA